MSPELKRIMDEVNNLNPLERAEIIDFILDSFNTDYDKDIERAWMDEARRRLEMYRNGETGTRSVDEVFASIVSDKK